MARGKKQILYEDIDKREVGYYATPKFVAKYLQDRLIEINPKGVNVLDPCCGKEELLKVFNKNNKIIDGFDIIQYKEEYICNFINKDFIEFYSMEKENFPLKYDYYIANPPYNCHEVDFIKDNKKKLNKLFNEVGTYNMYSMFIASLIDCAKDGAIIGLVTHDSFFTAKYHKGLREKILNTCTIHEITMCPRNLFLSQGADVGTSIVILQKGKENQKKVIVSDRVATIEEFKARLEYNKKSEVKRENLVLNGEKDNNEFVIDALDDVLNIFKNKRVGEVFKCITGISTGNDKLYLSKEKKDPYLIPFYKNPGRSRFYSNNYIYLHKDFIKLNAKIKNFNVRNKNFLYKSGVTCSSIGVEFTASRLPENFTYGVNANIICNDYDAWWLIGYLNSDLVTYMVRGILIRSNIITSGYVSRIPLLEFTQEEKENLNKLSKEAYNLAKDKKSIDNILIEINDIVNKASKISKKSIEIIYDFKNNIKKRT